MEILIWFTPAIPGVNSASVTVAGTPPKVAVAGMITADCGDAGAAAPLGTAGVTLPIPVR